MSMIKISIPMRALLLALLVSVLVPLAIWLVLQAYDWTCTHWVSCEGQKSPRSERK
ncbi:MAG: hypothetical protein VST66_03245 [Nitrospirota bacterium]|nr:hypothetical protein [Nitrospirota bacterium]